VRFEPAGDDQDEPGRRSLTLSGELDLADAQRVEQTVLRLCQEGADTIALDVTEVAFLDSAGFQALLACRRHCEEYYCEFELTRSDERVSHLFDMHGMLRRATVPGRRSRARGGAN
jgi:anti-anti-sigma factor